MRRPPVRTRTPAPFNFSPRKDVSIISANQKVGLDFECAVQSFFEDREIPIFDTPASHDYGGDLVLYRGGKVAVIQCKYHSAPVGIRAVQEVVGAIRYYRADCGIVISNQSFTRQAIALALANQVLLIDGAMLQEILEGVSEELPYIDEFLANLPAACGEQTTPAQKKPLPTAEPKRRGRPRRIVLRKIP